MTLRTNHRNLLIALFLLTAAVLACNTGKKADETDQANKLVDEGNSAFNEAKKNFSDAEALKDKMMHTNVSQLADARATAKDAIAAYNKAEDKLKEAAEKCNQATRLNLNDKFKEYLSLKVKEWNKRVEMVEAAKGLPQALIDSESRKGWVKKANEVQTKVAQLSKEADDLGAQADKLQKDNPDTIKK